LSRETREVVAYACGDRSEKTCQILWDHIPPAYKKALVFTDYWKAYPPVIPLEQHRPVGQETGETAHIERWNNTLRQHLGCFVRKTLSFSKCFSMHEICLKLFLHRYNTELLPSLWLMIQFKNNYYPGEVSDVTRNTPRLFRQNCSSARSRLPRSAPTQAVSMSMGMGTNTAAPGRVLCSTLRRRVSAGPVSSGAGCASSPMIRGR